jgi:hypothetical protein
MIERRRGVVLAFRQRATDGPPEIEPGAALDVARERQLNATWDRLLELTVQACTWRDPESLAAVEEVLRALMQETRREWFSS